MPRFDWTAIQGVPAVHYTCGYCGFSVASDKGWFGAESSNRNVFVNVRVCPNCTEPTYLGTAKQIPSPAFGERVAHLPPDVDRLYAEARDVTGVGAFTASVMICRKILANVAVALGADAGRTFAEYVAWLETSGHIPPKGRAWVDHIRGKGNEATHEIALMSEADAKQLIIFTSMLLRLTFEFPAQLAPVKANA